MKQDITIPIKLNGKSVAYPRAWEALKFKTYIKLLDKPTKIEQIKVIINDLGVTTAGSKIEGLGVVIKASSFLNKPPLVAEKPNRIGKYDIPPMINEETFDQYDQVVKIINTVKEQSIIQQTESLAYISAVYAQGFKNEFNAEKANELALEFMELPCTEVLAAGAFFQARFLSMESGLSMTYLQRNILWKKKRPVLDRLRRRLGLMLRLIPSRDM